MSYVCLNQHHGDEAFDTDLYETGCAMCEVAKLKHATEVLARLDAWLASNMAHSVVINNPVCWRIRLLRVGTGIPTRVVIGQEVQFATQPYEPYDASNTVYASQEGILKEDWPGLIPTIEAALDKWEETE